MFTGIITDIGTVVDISKTRDTRLVIETSFPLEQVEIGASIACSGVCLTVIEKAEHQFVVEASEETLACTTLQYWKKGERINLERALKMGDELGGHLVSGHVDGVGKIQEITVVDGSHSIVFTMPNALAPFVAQKGSITIDGVSLTVNNVTKETFSVNIIPHTWEYTTFSFKRAGDKVNLEIDVIARYIARAMEFQA